MFFTHGGAIGAPGRLRYLDLSTPYIGALNPAMQWWSVRQEAIANGKDQCGDDVR